uniref:uncharacterized protein LOC131130212 n=1 Tax=Doryrhamphus excisus TaxID=161450 RepID=UPI0025ADEAFB|nr:uncharacterized protein LOC131130212 [Doryrhamphus excisus]XP_057930466.1 uncharacterized protein LOC131130212 [Doryrhamphus excisus]
MNRSRIQMRANHDLLTPDTHAVAKISPVLQLRSEGVAVLSGEPSDTSKLTRSCPASHRLRFEDETEAEADSRYLDRQRQRTSHRFTGNLVCKPKLSLYVNSRKDAGLEANGATSARAVLSGVNPIQGPYRLDLWTEPIKETHIGLVTPPDSCRRGDVATGRLRVRTRRTDQIQVGGNRAPLKATPTKDLPINPYSPDLLPSGQILKQFHEEHQREVQEKKPYRDAGSHKSSTSEIAVNKQSLPPSGNTNDGQVREPMGEELHLPQPFGCRQHSSRLSLRRLFSSIAARRARTGSLDRLTAKPRPTSDPAPNRYQHQTMPVGSANEARAARKVGSEVLQQLLSCCHVNIKTRLEFCKSLCAHQVKKI